MKKWDYGKAFERFPCDDGKTWASKDNSIQLAIHDLRNGIHPLHLYSDCLFVDPPWNLGNLNSFITKADLVSYEKQFDDFLFNLFSIIEQINPEVCYVEMGKQNLNKVKDLLAKKFKSVLVFNSTYYHNKKNICFILRASNRDGEISIPDIEGIDEQDAIAKICAEEKFEQICDPCMGRGLVALYAAKNKRKCVGTELNHKRLSCAIEKVNSIIQMEKLK